MFSIFRYLFTDQSYDIQKKISDQDFLENKETQYITDSSNFNNSESNNFLKKIKKLIKYYYNNYKDLEAISNLNKNIESFNAYNEFIDNSNYQILNFKNELMNKYFIKLHIKNQKVELLSSAQYLSYIKIIYNILLHISLIKNKEYNYNGDLSSEKIIISKKRISLDNDNKTTKTEIIIDTAINLIGFNNIKGLKLLFKEIIPLCYNIRNINNDNLYIKDIYNHQKLTEILSNKYIKIYEGYKNNNNYIELLSNFLDIFCIIYNTKNIPKESGLINNIINKFAHKLGRRERSCEFEEYIKKLILENNFKSNKALNSQEKKQEQNLQQKFQKDIIKEINDSPKIPKALFRALILDKKDKDKLLNL